MRKNLWFRNSLYAIPVVVVAVIAWRVGELVLRNPVEDLQVPGPTIADSDPLEDRTTNDDAASHGKYLGSESCSACHSDLCETYTTHPMSRSMDIVRSSGTIEDAAESNHFLAPRNAGSGVYFGYQVDRGIEGTAHQEIAYDKNDNVICRRSEPVHYAIGSGQRGYSYLTNHDGLLFMSPITWYTGGQRWDISPAYDVVNKHFERRILDGCVACHAGNTALVPEVEHKFKADPFIEMRIGCERCHGPGEKHVAFRSAGVEGFSADDPIVNPERLEQPLRDDVCFQCHLQGAGRITRANRRDFDFRPGESIASTWTIFLKGTKVDSQKSTQAVGQAEQMLSSRCYLQSDGDMSCTSCHDPHMIPSDETRVQFYRQKCLACHGQGDAIDCPVELPQRLEKSPADSCIVCHMPRLPANDVPHTSQTDHRVVRHADDQTQNAVTNPEPQITIYEADAVEATVLDRAKGIFLTGRAEASGDRASAAQAIELLYPVVRSQPHDLQALQSLGVAQIIMGNSKAASEILRHVVEENPDSEYALMNLMVLSHDHGDLDAGIKYGRKLVALNPWHFEYHGRLAHMLGQKNDLYSGIDSALKAVEIQPWNAQIHGWLAEAYRATNQISLAEKHRQLYESQQPTTSSDAR